MSLRKKMALSFSVVSIILIILFGSILSSYYSNRYEEQTYIYCNQVVEANIHLIDYYFEQLKNVSHIIAKDKDIIKAVTYRNQTEEIQYSIELYNQRNVAEKIKQLDVLDSITNAMIIGEENEYLYYYGQSPVKGYDFSQNAWFEKAKTLNSQGISFTNFHETDYLLNHKERRTVSLLTPIQDSKQYFIKQNAWLMIDFNLEPIISEKNLNGDAYVAIYDHENPIYYSSETKLTEEQRRELEENLASGQENFIITASDNQPKYFVLNRTSQLSNWSILGIMPLDGIEKIHKTTMQVQLLLIFITAGLTILISMKISDSLLNPMKQLLKELESIGINHNFQKRRSHHSKCIEINLISGNIDKMLQRIENLSFELLEKQKRLSQEQMKVLQHQINPHFLNNVLQSMKAQAVQEGNHEISEMATMLGHILGYSIYNPFDLVPISEELRFVQYYMKLQNIRFNQKIQYSIECSENLGQILVPKLILQPLVENAIEHGFSDCNVGQIQISVMEDGDEVFLTVTNSGNWIEEEKLEKLNQMLESNNVYKESQSIGLMNVNQRIKGTFGPEAGVRVLSKVGRNTSIVINIFRES